MNDGIKIWIRRFNGATEFYPWKYSGVNVGRRADLKLQWGHGVLSVEITDPGGYYAGSEVASMGPRSFIRGNGMSYNL